MATIINGSAGVGFKMREENSAGQGAALKKDGPRELKLLKSKVGKSDKGNTTLALTLSVQDKDDMDEFNAVIYKGMPIDGTMQGGISDGRAHVLNVFELVSAAGRDDLHKTMHGDFDVEDLIDSIKDEPIYGYCRRQRDDDSKSEVGYFITKARYEQARSSGVNWRVDPRVGKAAPGATTPKAGANGAATRTNAASAAAALDAGV